MEIFRSPRPLIRPRADVLMALEEDGVAGREQRAGSPTVRGEAVASRSREARVHAEIFGTPRRLARSELETCGRPREEYDALGLSPRLRSDSSRGGGPTSTRRTRSASPQSSSAAVRRRRAAVPDAPPTWLYGAAVHQISRGGAEDKAQQHVFGSPRRVRQSPGPKARRCADTDNVPPSPQPSPRSEEVAQLALRRGDGAAPASPRTAASSDIFLWPLKGGVVYDNGSRSSWGGDDAGGAQRAAAGCSKGDPGRLAIFGKSRRWRGARQEDVRATAGVPDFCWAPPAASELRSSQEVDNPMQGCRSPRRLANSGSPRPDQLTSRKAFVGEDDGSPAGLGRLPASEAACRDIFGSPRHHSKKTARPRTGSPMNRMWTWLELPAPAAEPDGAWFGNASPR